MAPASLSFLRPEVAALKQRLDVFVEEDCIPNEELFASHLEHRHGAERWTRGAVPPGLARLQTKAKALGLWNLFIPRHLMSAVQQMDPAMAPSVSLTYREYGIMCESMGRSPWIAPEACNCSAPDTGNMEVLLEFGSDEQKRQYLLPLLRGEIRSAFLMTEPEVASSDATNLQTKLSKLSESQYVLSGRKWWSTGAMDPRCECFLVVSRMDYGKCPQASMHKAATSNHGAHTIVLVPRSSSGVTFERALTVFGYDDAPHGHAQVRLDNISLSPKDLILGEGSGFQVSQARLGPGRIHHCMRAVGMAARAYEQMLQRSMERETFGKRLYEHGGTQEMIADSLSDLEAARLLTLSCAAAMDAVGAKQARSSIASIKVTVPQLTYRVVDRAVQVHGGAGVVVDFLARALVGLRTLRIADGPDAVHKRSVARMEIRKAKEMMAKRRDGSHSRL